MKNSKYKLYIITFGIDIWNESVFITCAKNKKNALNNLNRIDTYISRYQHHNKFFLKIKKLKKKSKNYNYFISIPNENIIYNENGTRK